MIRRITQALLRSWPLPSVEATTSKEDRGRVVVMGGSKQVPGAVALAGEAALRAGAGKLLVVTGEAWAMNLALGMPEAAVASVSVDASGELEALSAAQVDQLRQASVVLVGPGMSTAASPAPAQAARAAPVLVADAGSLHAEALAPAAGRLIITPHVPEMADLMGLTPQGVARNAPDVAVEAARRFNAVVVLKGPTTWIATEKVLWKHEVEAPGLGTCGSGDVLAGLISGLVARGASPAQAGVWGVAVHARAGLRAARQIAITGFLARELLPRIPKTLQALS
jgi:hydroxyethylthiazole kinase-like uncharacterized protein yjeF